MLQAVDLGDHVLQLRFLEAGSGNGPCGWIHEKTVPFTIIAQALTGAYEVFSDRGYVRTTGSEAFLVPANTPLRIVHHGPGDGADMSFRFVHVQFTIYETVDIFQLFRLPLKTDEENGAKAGVWIEELLTLQHAGKANRFIDAARKTEMAYRFLNLLLDVSRPAEHHDRFLSGTKELLPVLSYIRQNLAEPITVEKLLPISPLSRTALFQLFKTAFRQTPMQYVKTVRLNEAYKQLCATADSIGVIGERCGFATTNHFCREFKEAYRQTPSEARRAHRNAIL